MTEYVLVETTGVRWLGALRWRGPESKDGYATPEDAQARAVVIRTRYAAKYGNTGGPRFKVEPRKRQSKAA